MKKEWKKDCTETFRAFSNRIPKENRLKKLWVDKGTQFAGQFKNCSAEGIHKYSTMSEAKAAFAERTTRSLKNVLHRYMEDHSYKYIHKLSKFLTNMISRKIVRDFITKNVKNSDFLSILYSKRLTESRETKFKIRDRNIISLEVRLTIQEGL